MYKSTAIEKDHIVPAVHRAYDETSFFKDRSHLGPSQDSLRSWGYPAAKKKSTGPLRNVLVYQPPKVALGGVYVQKLSLKEIGAWKRPPTAV